MPALKNPAPTNHLGNLNTAGSLPAPLELTKVQVEGGKGENQPYVVVCDPGMESERELRHFATFAEAYSFVQPRVNRGAHLDIMKRAADGSLTTEF